MKKDICELSAKSLVLHLSLAVMLLFYSVVGIGRVCELNEEGYM